MIPSKIVHLFLLYIFVNFCCVDKDESAKKYFVVVAYVSITSMYTFPKQQVHTLYARVYIWIELMTWHLFVGL